MGCVRENIEQPLWVSEVVRDETGGYGGQPGEGTKMMNNPKE